MTSTRHIVSDLDRLNAALNAAGAVVTCDDGFRYIDESKAPESVVRAYRAVTQAAYAAGVL